MSYIDPSDPDRLASLFAGIMAISGIDIIDRNHLNFLMALVDFEDWLCGITLFEHLMSQDNNWYMYGDEAVYRWDINTVRYIIWCQLDCTIIHSIHSGEAVLVHGSTLPPASRFDGWLLVFDHGYTFRMDCINAITDRELTLERIIYYGGSDMYVFVRWSHIPELLPFDIGYNAIVPADQVILMPTPERDPKILSLVAGALAAGGFDAGCSDLLNHFLLLEPGLYASLREIAELDDRWFMSEHGPVFRWHAHEVIEIWNRFDLFICWDWRIVDWLGWWDYPCHPRTFSGWVFLLAHRDGNGTHRVYVNVWNASDVWQVREQLMQIDSFGIYIRWAETPEQLPPLLFTDIFMPPWQVGGVTCPNQTLSVFAGILAAGGMPISCTLTLSSIHGVTGSTWLPWLPYFASQMNRFYETYNYGTVFRWDQNFFSWYWYHIRWNLFTWNATIIDGLMLPSKEARFDGWLLHIPHLGRSFRLDRVNFMMDFDIAWQRVEDRSGSSTCVYIKWEWHPLHLSVVYERYNLVICASLVHCTLPLPPPPPLFEQSTYSYRADGLRLKTTKTNDNGSTDSVIFVWDGMNIVLELNGNGVVTNRYTRGAGGRLIRSDVHGWYLHDVRGSVVQRVNDAGQVLHTYRYSAFGIELSYDPNNSNPFRFNGEMWESHRGEYYLRARSFNPRTGRFSQPDPFWGINNMQSSTHAIMQSGNLFVAMGNNPVMFSDPTGLYFIIAWSYSNSDINTFNQWLFNNGHSDSLMSGTADWTAAHWSEFDSRDAFSRAAQTRRNELIAMGIPASDIHLHRIDSRDQLAQLWDVWAQFEIVERLDFFSHVADVRGGSGDFWDSAPVLNWGATLRSVTVNGRTTGLITNPSARFHGCRTARGDFAQNFANRQGVATFGNYYGSNFSNSANWRLPHHRINPHATTLGVYLRVYGNSRGHGRAVDMIRFMPQ